MPETEPKDSVASEYDIEATEPTTTPAPAVETSEAPAAEAKSERPRDPSTGRFLPRDIIPEAPESASAPAPPAHSNWLVQRALDLGMSDDDIRHTPNAELHQIVLAQMQSDKQFVKDHGIEQAINRNKVPDLQLDENEINPQIISAIKAIREENQQLRDQLEQVKRGQQAQVAETVSGCFQSAFDSDPDLFGAGSNHDIPKGSAEYIRRSAMIETVKKMPARNLQELTRNINTVKAKLFGTTEAPSTGKHTVSPEEWARAGMAKPTNRIVNLPKGDKRAINGVAERLSTLNAVPDTEESGYATLDDFHGQ